MPLALARTPSSERPLVPARSQTKDQTPPIFQPSPSPKKAKGRLPLRPRQGPKRRSKSHETTSLAHRPNQGPRLRDSMGLRNRRNKGPKASRAPNITGLGEALPNRRTPASRKFVLRSFVVDEGPKARNTQPGPTAQDSDQTHISRAEGPTHTLRSGLCG